MNNNDIFLLCTLGQILWRKVLEKGYAGRIQAFSNAADSELVTVNGGVPAFIVRYWNLNTGHILKEWIIAEQNPERYLGTTYFFPNYGQIDVLLI